MIAVSHTIATQQRLSTAGVTQVKISVNSNGRCIYEGIPCMKLFLHYSSHLLTHLFNSIQPNSTHLSSLSKQSKKQKVRSNTFLFPGPSPPPSHLRVRRGGTEKNNDEKKRKDYHQRPDCRLYVRPSIVPCRHILS